MSFYIFCMYMCNKLCLKVYSLEAVMANPTRFVLDKKYEDINSFFDIVLIDGIDRGRCASEAERIVRPGGIIMCHDTDFPGMFDMVNDKLADNVYYFGEHVNGSKTSIWIRK